MSLHVVVIGAGIVGAATALSLLRDGHRVTILDPGEPGGAQAASYGNGCWLSSMSVIPVASPRLWRRVPSMLADPLGPLAIRWSYLPRLAPWLIRLLRAGSTEEKVAATARVLRTLLDGAPALHRRLATEAGVGALIEQRGLLYVYPDRAAFEAEAMSWRIRRQTGLDWIELDADELRQQEPELDRRYGFGVLYEDGAHCRDPGAYVAALVAHAVAQGAVLKRAHATGFRIQSRRLYAVETDQGDIACQKAVIAAGAWSRTLAKRAGDSVPLETERGYHAQIEGVQVGPRRPLMPSDGKMSVTMTDRGLRCSGQVELAGLAAAPNWKRADILRDHLLRSFPALPRDIPAERVKFWMGHRPSIADGLPVIGPASGADGIFHAFGHGHVGLVAGAPTGQIVADLIARRDPSIDIAPFAATRFR